MPVGKTKKEIERARREKLRFPFFSKATDSVIDKEKLCEMILRKTEIKIIKETC